MDSPGLYIHVPFCRKRCPFCDFAITTDLSRVTKWEDALIREIALRSDDWPAPFDTVYFGGGTPSLLPAERIEKLLASMRQRLRIAEDAEVTLEANPGTLSQEDYARLVDAGVRRLSLGIQSFDDDDLVLLGRDHDVQESRDAFAFARAAGMDNITVDLIYGLPGRDADHWTDQIRQCVALDPDHVSAYALTYEPGTPLTRQKERGELDAISESLSSDLFDLTVRQLAEHGFDQYEVSSFASGIAFESRHNKKHWCGVPYLGLGPSAHSFRDGRRWWNHRNVSEYADTLARGELPVAEVEDLTVDQRRLEALFLGLRWRAGVDFARFDREFGLDLRTSKSEVIDQLVRDGLAHEDDNCLRLSRSGLARADAIARKLT